MQYTSVPLPRPLIQLIDRIVQIETNSYRSRPDYILQHMRSIIQTDIDKLKTGIENETRD